EGGLDEHLLVAHRGEQVAHRAVVPVARRGGRRLGEELRGEGGEERRGGGGAQEVAAFHGWTMYGHALRVKTQIHSHPDSGCARYTENNNRGSLHASRGLTAINK